jgi:hypothetical protein
VTSEQPIGLADRRSTACCGLEDAEGDQPEGPPGDAAGGVEDHVVDVDAATRRGSEGQLAVDPLIRWCGRPMSGRGSSSATTG